MITLEAKIRTVSGKGNKAKRISGLIPAVIYGHKIKNQNLELPYSKFIKVYEQAGESSLVDLKIEAEKPIKVLIQDIEIDPLTQKIMHIDFYQVRQDEEITVEVEINFIGESPAVKDLGGVLIKTLDSIKIECLPKDLIRQVDIDLSQLKQIGDTIHVGDLKFPKEIKILEKLDEPVVAVSEPRSEKELEELKEKPAETVLPEGAEEKVPEGEGVVEGGSKE